MLVVCSCCRQQRELIDVDVGRLTAELQAAKAAAADAGGLLQAAEASAQQRVQAAQDAQSLVSEQQLTQKVTGGGVRRLCAIFGLS